MMRSAIRVSAVLVALGACLGLVTAQQHSAALEETVGLGSSGSGYAAIVDDYDLETEITGSVVLASAPRLSLTEEQRGLIFLGVINLPDVPDVAMRDVAMPDEATPDVVMPDVAMGPPELGMLLSQAVELHELPAMVVRLVPEVGGYRFVKLEDRILLVSAETRQVETMIPRYKLVFH